MTELLVIGMVVLVSLTSILALISRDWRYCVGSLAIQYIGVFLLVSQYWPLGMAITKLLAGWMACAILGTAMTYVPEVWSDTERNLRFGTLFRILAALIVALAITSLANLSQAWLTTMSVSVRWGSFFLIGIGLLQLSLTSHPLRVIIGLLTVISGFEIIYASVETSTLVTGLLAVVNLSLALIGAYLVIAPAMEANP